MKQRTLLLLVALPSLLLLPACGPGGGSDKGCRAKLLVGDLVITEIMANPDGTDTGREWFEVFNNSGAPQDLTGLRIIASRADGSGEKGHTVAGLTIETDAYLTFGSFEDPVPAWLDYSYGNGLGSLRNSDGRVALGCGDTIVDEVTYASTSDGKSRTFTGALAPDYTANDEADNWCNASAEYEAGSAGSPGARNEVCPGGPSPTECEEGGVLRTIVAPAVGDLVVSEVMPNPSAVADAQGEWFEVYVGRDVDLNGLQIGKTPGSPSVTLSETRCLRAVAGTYLVFARDADPQINGGLTGVFAPFSFGLTNSGGSLFVGLEGTVLDAVSWTGSSAGVSLSLDPGALDPLANDDPSRWCEGTGTYGDGDTGTPGAANAACPLIPPEGSCVEGGTSIRALVAPTQGDLEITEVMPNPSAVGDSAGEWFELKVNRDVDLNGLEMGTDVSAGTVRGTLDATECLRVRAGSYTVIAREADAAVNGGLPQVDALFAFALTNSSSGLFIGHGGAILDSTTWTSSVSGASRSRDPANAGLWCDASDLSPQPTYGAGDFGTPAAQNPACP